MKKMNSSKKKTAIQKALAKNDVSENQEHMNTMVKTVSGLAESLNLFITARIQEKEEEKQARKRKSKKRKQKQCTYMDH